MEHRRKLFSVVGVDVRADPSWLLVVALIAWTLATQLFPGELRQAQPSVGTLWIMGFAGALGLFASVLVHELAHAVVARRSGVEMAGITLFLFGGVAEMREEPKTAKTELAIALVGPLTSIVIGFVLLALALPGRSAWGAQPAVLVVEYLGWMNLALAAFNLLPAFPLDGGRVLRALLWWRGRELRRATRISSRIGASLGLGLMFVGVMNLFAGDLIGGLWLVLIGLFVRAAAHRTYADLVDRLALRSEPVSRFMRTDVIAVPGTLSLAELVDGFIYRHHHKLFPVADGERALGLVSTTDVGRVPRERWSTTRVADVLEPLSADNSVAPDADAAEVIAQMTRTGRSRLVVVDASRLVGIVTLKDLRWVLDVKRQLEPAAEEPQPTRGRMTAASAQHSRSSPPPSFPVAHR